MLFNSLSFLVFLPIAVVGYYCIPPSLRWLWLLLLSAYFYASFVPAYLLILGTLIAVDYGLGRAIESETSPLRRKAFLWLGIFLSFGSLFVFKYFNFVNENIASLAHFLGWNYPIEALVLLLPLGLSFHIFQCVSYLIDVYRKKVPAERHVGIFALFVLFFPQLVAGPIERAGNLLPQLRVEHAFSIENIRRGLVLCLVGFFLKLVVADRAAIIVNAVYADPSAFSGPAILLALVMFAFQLYGDFAGYTLIALGSAQMLGMTLMENFRRPYLAKSVTEFWQRWHISLSTWLRDYVYESVLRLHTRMSLRALITAVILTFLASGIWHGAGWNFVLMGLWFGIIVTLELLTRKWRARLPALGAGLITFTLVLFGWMLFRTPSLSVAAELLTRLPIGWASFANAFSYGVPLTELMVTLAAAAGLMTVEALMERSDRLKERLSSPFFGAFAYSFLVLLILVFGEFGEHVFIYFQF